MTVLMHTVVALSLIPYSHCKPKRSGPKRTEPYCRIHTIHTSTECAAMRIPQFDSFHTAHSRMWFVSHWKRSEAKRSALFSVVMGSAILFNAVSRPIFIFINIRSSRVPSKCRLNVAPNRQQDNPGKTQKSPTFWMFGVKRTSRGT